MGRADPLRAEAVAGIRAATLRAYAGGEDLLTIFAQTTPEAVTAQHRAIADSIRSSFPEIADMLEAAEADLTGFASMPREHWQKVWSNNSIEHLNREIERRADAVQIFPERNSVTRLNGAVLQEQHEEWQHGERRYFSDISMRKLVHTLLETTEPAHPELYLTT